MAAARPVVFLLCVKGALLVSLGGSAAATEPPHVLLLTLDTVRADHLEIYGYRHGETPALRGLARDGVTFDQAYAQVPLTLPSHATILTGTYPMYHGVRDFTGKGLSQDQVTLAQLLRERGYATAAFVSAYVLDSIWGLDQGFDTYFDQFDLQRFKEVNPGNIQRRGEETVSEALRWLQRRPAGKNFFVWVHLFDPHSAYDPPEPFKSRYADRPYDGEIAYTDAQVGRLIQFLKEQRLYDSTLVILLSDHGEGLGDHGESEHGFFVYESTVRIPLVLKPPAALRGWHARVGTPVSTVDVAPTVLQFCQIRNPPLPLQGRGLLGWILGKERTPEPVYAETYYPKSSFGWHPLEAVRSGRYKYIGAPRPELYDLSRDPAEKHNLFESQRGLAGQLQQQLEDFRTKYVRTGGAPNPIVSDPETLEKLRSLGYLGYAAARTAGSKQPGQADPKDKIEVFNSILQAMDLAEAGQWRRSNETLAQVLRTDPDLYTVHYLQGQNHFRLGQFPQALDSFKRTLDLHPAFESAVFKLAHTYALLRQPDAALAGYRRVLELNPNHFMAHHNLGMALFNKGDITGALQEVQTSLKLQPDFPEGHVSLGMLLIHARRYEEAAVALEKAARLDPANSAGQNYLGIAYRNLGKTKEAKEAYLRAIALKKDYAEAYLNLSFAYRQLGEVRKAEEAFEESCRLDPALCRQYPAPR